MNNLLLILLLLSSIFSFTLITGRGGLPPGSSVVALVSYDSAPHGLVVLLSDHRTLHYYIPPVPVFKPMTSPSIPLHTRDPTRLYYAPSEVLNVAVAADAVGSPVLLVSTVSGDDVAVHELSSTWEPSTVGVFGAPPLVADAYGQTLVLGPGAGGRGVVSLLRSGSSWHRARAPDAPLWLPFAGTASDMTGACNQDVVLAVALPATGPRCQDALGNDLGAAAAAAAAAGEDEGLYCPHLQVFSVSAAGTLTAVGAPAAVHSGMVGLAPLDAAGEAVVDVAYTVCAGEDCGELSALVIVRNVQPPVCGTGGTNCRKKTNLCVESERTFGVTGKDRPRFTAGNGDYPSTSVIYGEIWLPINLSPACGASVQGIVAHPSPDQPQPAVWRPSGVSPGVFTQNTQPELLVPVIYGQTPGLALVTTTMVGRNPEPAIEPASTLGCTVVAAAAAVDLGEQGLVGIALAGSEEPLAFVSGRTSFVRTVVRGSEGATVKAGTADATTGAARGVTSAGRGVGSISVPYSVLGLGASPQYVEALSVGDHRGSHVFEALLPNVRLIVHADSKPASWSLEMEVAFPAAAGYVAAVIVVLVLILGSLLIVIKERARKQREKERKALRKLFGI